jgi:hypothetical protein
MMTRDEYVTKLKVRLDQWNAEAAKWETEANATKAKQLEAFRLQRDEALSKLKALENASASAWKDFAKGADEAWDRLRDAAAKARTHFEKEKSPKSRV